MTCFRRSTSLILCALLTACASDPNALYFESGMVKHEVLDIGPGQYKLTTMGAGAHKGEQVLRAFDIRAEKLCPGGKFSHPPLKLEPRQYTSSGGGFSFVHNAFQVVSVVTCS